MLSICSTQKLCHLVKGYRQITFRNDQKESNVAQILIFVLIKIENIVRIGESADNQHF